MKLIINDDCCSCSFCYRACPVDAPYFDGEKTQIDQEKCISCGKCISECPMGAIYDEEKPAKAVKPHELQEYQCDAVIIGAGASGMVSAVRLAEQGKSVVVLEKEKKTGAGAMHVAGPMQIIDTKWALDAGEKPKTEERIQEIIEYSHGLLDPELIRNTVPALPRFFDWLCTFTDTSKGFALKEGHMGPPPMPVPMDEEPQEAVIAGSGMPGSAMGGNEGLIVEGKAYSDDSPLFHNSGEFIMKNLFARAKELNVRILNQTTATSLIKDDKDQITGVLAKDPGGEIKVQAKVCLVATGSLILGDIIKEVAPDFAKCFQPRYGHTIKSYTGDGYKMCEAAGIPVKKEDIWVNITGSLVMPCDGLTVEYGQATGKRPMIPTDLRSYNARPETLMVNIKGERYQNEQMANITVAEQLKQPQGLSYTVYTEKMMKAKPEKWIPVKDQNGHVMRTFLPMGMPVEPWNDEHMKWLDSMKNNHLVIADTLEEVAERIGMDVNTFKETVAHYNELCAKKADDDFGKNALYLQPIEEGPYYAVKTFIMTDGAEGGIPIDANCHVMGENGAISNLFAAGDNSSGNIVRTGENDKIWITNEFSWALSSGMIASDSMLVQLNK